MTQMHSLAGSPRGRRALRHLLSPASAASPEPDPELLLDATATSTVDAFLGAVLIANVEQHLERVEHARVEIWPPRSGDVLGRFCDVLALRPERCALSLPAGQTAPVRDPRILVPAVRIASMDEADGLTRFLRAASQASRLGTARLTPAEARFFGTALPALAENALVHAPDSPCGVVICSALEADNREAQLVALDLGSGVADSRSSLAEVRSAWTRSRESLGGLFYTVEYARKLGLDVSMQISTGRASARWRERWHSDEAEFSPGWTATFTIHR